MKMETVLVAPFAPDQGAACQRRRQVESRPAVRLEPISAEDDTGPVEAGEIELPPAATDRHPKPGSTA